MKTGLSLTQLAQEIERRASAKRDFVAPTGRLQMGVSTESGDGESPRQFPVLRMAGTDTQMAVNKVAHGQLAEYAGIPTAYYRKMVDEAPALLAANVNRWLGDRMSDRRMVRTLDGTVRAILSDKYRPLENEDLAEAILPVLLEQDLMIMSCEITETRMYIKAVDRRINLDCPRGTAMGDGSHNIFDTLSPAIIISNSEVGHGALAIESGVFTKACTNMAIFGANMRKYHTGARAELSDEVYALLSDKTKRITDAAVWSQTRDLVTAAFDQAKFEATVGKLRDATQDRMGDDPVKAIDLVGKRFGFGEGERKGILTSLIEGGDLSRYGLHSAVTHFSAKVDEYDRATELERVGGKIIELPRSEWQQILKAA